MKQASATPRLQAPGAGLPFLEGLVVRYYYGPFVAARAGFEDCERGFAVVNDKILKCTEGFTDEQMSKQVLVPRQRGLEDSSRFWSMAMTLEHLLIVSPGMERIITALVEGKDPGIVVDVAKVKPLGGLSSREALVQFKQFTSEVFDRLRQIGADRDHPARWYHPWFGPINARQWTWLLMSHHGIHLRQMREIQKILKAEDTRPSA